MLFEGIITIVTILLYFSWVQCGVCKLSDSFEIEILY